MLSALGLASPRCLVARDRDMPVPVNIWIPLDSFLLDIEVPHVREVIINLEGSAASG
jgi:hypothetical protein